MKVNIGAADRIIRVIVAIIIAILYFTDQITGVAAIILGILAIGLVLTSLVGSCPMYIPLKISTKKKKEASE